MQCKDINDKDILLFLNKNPEKWHTWFGNQFENSVTNVMPKNVNGKLALAKMKQLIKRGLVDGCDCGCRGDFVITEKGKKFIEEL